jgi:hypothetical protein
MPALACFSAVQKIGRSGGSGSGAAGQLFEKLTLETKTLIFSSDIFVWPFYHQLRSLAPTSRCHGFS